MRFPSSSHRAAALASLLTAAVPALAGTTVVEQPGRGTNRIEVTGNRADGDARARCGERHADGSANRNATNTTNVNSVNIRGQALSGKTIIVTDGGGDGCPTTGNGGANVNSVNIR